MMRPAGPMRVSFMALWDSRRENQVLKEPDNTGKLKLELQ